MFNILESSGSQQQNKGTFLGYPTGIWPHSQKVRDANRIAKAALMLARWVWHEFGATVVMENPDQSYLWLYGQPYVGSPKEYKYVRCSYCMFGT